MNDLLTIKDAAAELNVSVALLRKNCQQGGIRAEKLGNTWLVDRAAIAEFANRETKRGPKGPRKNKESQ